MKKRWLLFLLVGVSMVTISTLPAAWAKKAKAKEHAGHDHAKEHGGQEHGGTAVQATQSAEPTAEAIRSTISKFIEEKQQSQGGFYTINDAVAGKERRLQLKQVHERVGKTGDYYYSCTDMTDADTGEVLDLDFDVANDNGALRVLPDKARIHKVNEEARYTYDQNDNMISVEEVPVAQPMETQPADAQPAETQPEAAPETK